VFSKLFGGNLNPQVFT